MRLVTEALPLAGGVIGTGGEVQWPRPTRPGDELRVECEAVGVQPSRSRPGEGLGHPTRDDAEPGGRAGAAADRQAAGAAPNSERVIPGAAAEGSRIEFCRRLTTMAPTIASPRSVPIDSLKAIRAMVL